MTQGSYMKALILICTVKEWYHIGSGYGDWFHLITVICDLMPPLTIILTMKNGAKHMYVFQRTHGSKYYSREIKNLIWTGLSACHNISMTYIKKIVETFQGRSVVHLWRFRLHFHLIVHWNLQLYMENKTLKQIVRLSIAIHPLQWILTI